MAQRRETEKELQDWLSSLAGLSRDRLFQVPDSYFEELPVQMNKKVEKNVAESRSPFVVPEGYFDSLPTCVLQRAENATQTAERKYSHRILLIRKWTLAAAALLLLLLGAEFLQVPGVVHPVEASVEAVPAHDLREYLQQTSPELQTNPEVVVPVGSLPPQISNQEITEYLNETGWN